MGIKSIRCCLNNFLFTQGCDSAACQHISASFQELALQDETRLSEDLASVLPLIGTTLEELEKELDGRGERNILGTTLSKQSTEDLGFKEALCCL